MREGLASETNRRACMHTTNPSLRMRYDERPLNLEPTEVSDPMLPGEAALSLTTSLCSPSCFSRSLMEKPSSSSSLSLVLLSLPSELLEQILLSSPLSVPDLCRVRSVCWHFKNVVDRLWTKVARSRFVNTHPAVRNAVVVHY